MAKVDLITRGNKDDALREFDHCMTDDEFCRWAKKWGRAFCENALGGSLGEIPHADIYDKNGKR